MHNCVQKLQRNARALEYKVALEVLDLRNPLLDPEAAQVAPQESGCLYDLQGEVLLRRASLGA